MLSEIINKAFEEAPSVVVVIAVFYMAFRNFRKSSELEHKATRESISGVDKRLQRSMEEHTDLKIRHERLEERVDGLQTCRATLTNSNGS